jgi:DNA recombination protein RmuC
MLIWISLAAVVTLALGFWIGRMQGLARVSELAARMSERESALVGLRQELELARRFEPEVAELRARLDLERKGSAEKLAVLSEAQRQLSDHFKALSSEALKSSNASFLTLAKETLEKFQSEARQDLEKRQLSIDSLVKPVKESLEKVDLKIGELEKSRVGAYESIKQQVQSLVDSQKELRSETSNLVKALRAPHVRGRWGEIQLKRVVEMAGMLEHCDFFQQETVQADEGALRPDLVVRLPGGKSIVVDAKAPLSAYLEAIESPDEATRQERMQQHAQQIRTHMLKLSRKGYWDQFQPSPEFVVLFIPGETFFSAALEQDPALIEVGVEQKVILATPTTLIALLRAVSYGWRQEGLAKNAQKISDLGKELYKRLSDFGDHLSNVGKNLNSAVKSYNGAVGSLESRVLVSARKFQELEVSADTSHEIAELLPIEASPRALQDSGSIP